MDFGLLFWALLAISIILGGLFVYFRALFLIPKEHEKRTGQKVSLRDRIFLLIFGILFLFVLFFWQYLTQK